MYSYLSRNKKLLPNRQQWNMLNQWKHKYKIVMPVYFGICTDSTGGVPDPPEAERDDVRILIFLF
jgi:hypothetical protein